MKKALKIFAIVLGVILAGVLIFALINIKSVLLAFGIGKLDVKSYDAAKSTLEQSQLYTDIEVADVSGDDNTRAITCSTQDGVADFVIQGNEGEAITKIDAEIHGELLKDIDPTNVAALSEKAKTYLSPIIADDQVLGLSGFVAKEALKQYNQGKTLISIQQDFDGVSVSINGDINTQQFTVEIITNPK